MAVYHANIVSVDVTSFLFSESYMSAINAKATEEQKKLEEKKEIIIIKIKKKLLKEKENIIIVKNK